MNKNMKKISLSILLSVLMLSILSVNVFADNYSTDTIMPRWDSISAVDVELSFNDSNNTGTITGYARKKTGATSIEGTLYLYKLEGSDWICIGEWYNCKTVGSLVVSGNFVCESGVTYKGVFEVTAYTNEISETTSVENSRTCP